MSTPARRSPPCASLDPEEQRVPAARHCFREEGRWATFAATLSFQICRYASRNPAAQQPRGTPSQASSQVGSQRLGLSNSAPGPRHLRNAFLGRAFPRRSGGRRRPTPLAFGAVENPAAKWWTSVAAHLPDLLSMASKQRPRRRRANARAWRFVWVRFSVEVLGFLRVMEARAANICYFPRTAL